MDVNELARSLQALLNEQAKPPTSQPHQPQDELLVSAPEPISEPEPDPFFEHYFVPETPPAADYTASLPAYSPDPEDPYGVFDDHLLDHTEETGDVKVTNVANATYRAKRTGVQGLLAAVIVAVGGVMAAIPLDIDLDWKMLGLLVGEAVLTAVISFLHNDKTAKANSAE
jgi:hypothetical protein